MMRPMRRWFLVGWASLSAVLVATTAVFAVDMTSPSFQNFDSSAIPTQFKITSANYVLDASVETIVNKARGANLKGEPGAAAKGGVGAGAPPASPGWWGGGGGGRRAGRRS